MHARNRFLAKSTVKNVPIVVDTDFSGTGGSWAFVEATALLKEVGLWSSSCLSRLHMAWGQVCHVQEANVTAIAHSTLVDESSALLTGLMHMRLSLEEKSSAVLVVTAETVRCEPTKRASRRVLGPALGQDVFASKSITSS